MPCDASLSKPHRPIPIVLLCMLLGAALFWTLWSARRGDLTRAFGIAYWPYLSTIATGLAVSGVGLWRMRRWAPILLAAVLGVDCAVAWTMGEGHWLPTVISVISLTIAFAYRPRMR